MTVDNSYTDREYVLIPEALVEQLVSRLRCDEIRFLLANPNCCTQCQHLLLFHQFEYAGCDLPDCRCTRDPYTGQAAEREHTE